MTTKKKICISVSAIILIIILWSVLITVSNRGVFTKVTCGHFDMSPSSVYLLTPDGFLFDTGSGGSVILDDSLRTIPFVGIGFNSDYSRQYRLVTYSFLPTLSLNERTAIHNILTDNQKDNDFFRKKGIKIILGMDVIHKVNWLFSFRKNRAQTLPLNQIPSIPSNALCIPFDDNRTPTGRLKIRQTTLEFLIDTGYKGELSIQDPSALKEISTGLKFRTDTVNFHGLFGEYTEREHTLDSLTIEGMNYKNIVIREAKLNLIGLNFLRRYDTMLWDSFNKRMYLWNESSSSD